MLVENAENLGPIDLLYSAADHILSAAQGTAHLQNFSDFAESVTWGDPFIQFLISFQVLLFAVTYMTRKRDIVQFVILSCIAVIALLAERLNMYGKKHWAAFASQDYFDRNGLFMLLFVSGPFVILANFIVIGMGLRLLKLYAKKKRKELLNQRQGANPSQSASNKKDE